MVEIWSANLERYSSVKGGRGGTKKKEKPTVKLGDAHTGHRTKKSCKKG